MEKLKQLSSSNFWQQRWVQVVFGLLALGLASALASYAIDSGSLLQWFLAVFWVIVGLRELVVAILPHKQGNSST